MRHFPLVAFAAAAIAVGAASLFSSTTGYYTSGVTRSAPSCGGCHRATPGAAAGAAALAVSLAPSARVLTSQQAITLTAAVTGGTAGTAGGFAADATAGRFTAGTGSKLFASGAAIGHSSSSRRSWSFGYTAPATPGPVDLYAVAATVDGNGRANSADAWAFHGFDSTATVSTPVRLYVNAAGVQAIGSSCVGSHGNFPVLGARVAPMTGSAFAVELRGAPPATPVALLLGATPGYRVDLGPAGITGCILHVAALVVLPGATGAGNPERGEGTATFPLPIPANPWLVGFSLETQVAIVDPNNGRPLPVTMTNGLSLTIQ